MVRRDDQAGRDGKSIAKASRWWRTAQVVRARQWVNTYNQWMNNIQDWCISRQLWWGHQIPAWYGIDGRSSSPRATGRSAERAADGYAGR